MIIRLRDRSESDRERHPTRRHAPQLTLLYNSPRRRHTTRNAHGGSGGGDDGSGTFALSQPATTVRKVIRGFSRRRAPGFYTTAATCILPPPQSPASRTWGPAAALDVLAENWGHLDSSAPRQCKRAGGHSHGSVALSHHHPHSIHAVSCHHPQSFIRPRRLLYYYYYYYTILLCV